MRDETLEARPMGGVQVRPILLLFTVGMNSLDPHTGKLLLSLLPPITPLSTLHDRALEDETLCTPALGDQLFGPVLPLCSVNTSHLSPRERKLMLELLPHLPLVTTQMSREVAMVLIHRRGRLEAMIVE